MTEVRIRLRDDGPLVVEGNVTVADAEGNEFSAPSNKPALALCRCGVSEKKPFCDGTHHQVGFESAPRATEQRPS